MSYDWHRSLEAAEGTREFFDAIDARLFNASPFFQGKRPFERFIPFEVLKGKRVLEIGCGLGSHAELFARAGCRLTAIDLTEKAVELTRERLRLRGFPADIRRMDAEEMEFQNGEFDFVWSWGVIHHSADPERIIRNVYRVLKDGGEFRFMVYHRRSLNAFTSIVRGFLSGKVFQGMSASDILSFYTDGYVARFYTQAEVSKFLSRARFLKVSTCVLGQKSELVPLPARGLVGQLKSFILKNFPGPVAEYFLSSYGALLFAIASKSCEPKSEERSSVDRQNDTNISRQGVSRCI